VSGFGVLEIKTSLVSAPLPWVILLLSHMNKCSNLKKYYILVNLVTISLTENIFIIYTILEKYNLYIAEPSIFPRAATTLLLRFH